MGDYDGPLRRIVLAAKHSARTDVTDFLAEAGACLGASLASVLGVAGSPAAAVGSLDGRAPSTGSAVDVWVVPAPSSWKRRLRGRQVALPLARAVARALAAGARPGVRVRVVDAVRLRIGATSQSGKAGAQRTVGRMGSMRALAVPGPGVRVVAVDDVVTTGATIREMERVLGGLDAVVAICRPGLIT
jgi:putative purine/pyrimidine phosphoribosyl transferase